MYLRHAPSTPSADFVRSAMLVSYSDALRCECRTVRQWLDKGFVTTDGTTGRLNSAAITANKEWEPAVQRVVLRCMYTFTESPAQIWSLPCSLAVMRIRRCTTNRPRPKVTGRYGLSLLSSRERCCANHSMQSVSLCMICLLLCDSIVDNLCVVRVGSSHGRRVDAQALLRLDQD